MKTLLFKNHLKKINCFQSQISILHVVVSSVMQFDKSLNAVVLYKNDLFCIIMNINENLENERNIIWKLDLLCTPRKYSYGGHFVQCTPFIQNKSVLKINS